jgi:DNA-3-methyladenine glycosylase II
MSPQPAVAAEEHLRAADPVLGAIIDAVIREGDPPALPPDPSRPRDPNMPTDRYGVLVRAIVSQNISEIASAAIYRRLIERFGGRPPEPREILAADPQDLLAVGLSHAKVASLRSLAEHMLSGELDLARLHELPDDEVVARLSAVKGIGTWTADIFLMFHLYRHDVLPAGDLGLRRAVEQAYDLPAMPERAELERIAAPWRPCRTLACMYLWRTTESTPQV